jgi:hypothetical protein
VILQVPAREISRVVGQHRSNLERLERETGARVKKVIGLKNGNEILPIAAENL